MIASDHDYGGDSYGATFAADGRLATTSWDGQIRLYDPDFDLIQVKKAPGGERPFGVAFSPNGERLAIGYADGRSVDVLDGRTLAHMFSADTSGIDNGDLGTIAWSSDGETLFAGGRFDRDGVNPVVTWSEGGQGERRELRASDNTIMSLKPLKDGSLSVASQDPYLGLLDKEGKALWVQGPPKADFRAQRASLSVSPDGTLVDFGYKEWGEDQAGFDLTSLKLVPKPAEGEETSPPLQDGLDIVNWVASTTPMLDGKPLPLDHYEISRSLAIHPDRSRFVLGTDWFLRAFDDTGEQLWRVDVPSVVWATNITGDGRLVVAGHGDGTIRWYDMEDGRELLAFFPLVDRTNWVAWTPDGFYAATPGAHSVLRWHVNRGWDQPAEAIPVSEIAELRRPEVLPLVLQEMDIARALGLAELAKARRAVQLRTNSAIAPGAQLHVLAVGVGEHNDKAKHLRLAYADDDARDVASALSNTQASLYAKVNVQTLKNEDATKAGIFRALATMREQMQAGSDDVAVVHFSGHGALLDDKLYLLPHEVDARDPVGIKATAIEISALRTELRSLAEKGRVLVLLDACRSGAATENGVDFTADASAFRAILAGSNISVLTSSEGSELSREDDAWQNGAFTEILLQALERGADYDKNSVISSTELSRFVSQGVKQLTGGEQTPGMEVRYDRTLFAVGL